MRRIDLPESTTRRSLLKASLPAGAAAATISGAPLFFTRHAYGADFLNAPSGDTVTLGFTVAQSGAYADEGAEQLRGFELAVSHLNGEGDGGMLPTMQPSSLQGNGILGVRVTWVSGDTETRSDAAAALATRMIQDDGVVMIAGGSSTGVAITMQRVCHEAGILFMAGISHGNDTTGVDRSANGFRHFLNAAMTGRALGASLPVHLGTNRSAYYLTADYSWGYDNEATIQAFTEAAGWQSAGAQRTPVGAGDYALYLQAFLDSGADVLVLSHYGKDQVNSLNQAMQLGLHDLQRNGHDVALVVPLHTQLMAQAAGDAIEGVYGTSNWHWSLDDAASLAFRQSFEAAYGHPPSEAAHACYVQTLLYADACERAGTFDPCQVAAALENHTVDGLGNGSMSCRAADHQWFKDVPVLRGIQPVSAYDQLRIEEIVPRSAVEYVADDPAFAGDLGQCFNGSAADTGGGASDSGNGDSGSSGGGAVGLATLGALASMAMRQR